MMKRTRRQAQSNEQVLQLKIALQDSHPPIWRRVLVPSKISFTELHYIIQLAMGWTNSHLYEFRIRATRIGEPDEDMPDDVLDASVTFVDLVLQVAPDLQRFQYTYDFGDDWRHEIKIEKRLVGEPLQYYPCCIGGKRACPPEDCGGIYGYERLIEILKNPADSEYKSMMTWSGNFDPEDFSVDLANEALITIETAKEFWQ